MRRAGPAPCLDAQSHATIKIGARPAVEYENGHVHGFALSVALKMASDPVTGGQQTHSWHLHQDFLVKE
jgi:hypothetical protein